jgi:ATP-dependent Clp protease protease subunit
MVIEKSKHGERSFDIYSRLLEDRIIFLGEEVHAQMVNTIVAQMLFLEKKDPDKDITIYVNTRQEVRSIQWYGYLRCRCSMSKCDVQVVCVLDLAASMGSIYMAGGTKGKRFALPHSKIMIHQPLGGTKGQATDIIIQAEEMLKVKTTLTGVSPQTHRTTTKKYSKQIWKEISGLPLRKQWRMAW